MCSKQINIILSFNMKASTYSLITELCTSLGKDLVSESPDKNKLIKHMRSYAFEILLNERNISTYDDMKDDPTMLAFDITSHIYTSGKTRGEWSEEMSETVKVLMDTIETQAKADPLVIPVLKLLLSLADSAPPSVCLEEPSYGLDMKTLITDHDLKHRSFIKASPAFNSEMFELPGPLIYTDVGTADTQTYSKIPGKGLKHEEFFAVPTLRVSSSVGGLKDIDEYDFTNANWIFPKLQNISPEESVNNSATRISIHQDEGYVTPDQDIKTSKGRQEVAYFAWECMYEESFKSVYSWENFGSLSKKTESPFLSQNRDAVEHIWKIVHAHNITSYIDSKSVPIALKFVSLEDLEIAFKNLLIGVESSVFQYCSIKKTFVLQEGLYLDGSAAKSLEEYCEDFIECANSFHYLSSLTKKTNEMELPNNYGLVYQTLCNNIRHYLQCYRGIVLRMPTLQSLLQAHDWLYKLRTHLQLLVGLCQTENLPKGGALLTLLYDQVPIITRTDLAFLLYYILQSCCTVYFRFLEKWIFEGLSDDSHNEFFIESSSDITFNRKFWTRGFVLKKILVPGLLKGLESDIFVCGKSMALLKLCAPDDPVCLLVKHGYPGVVCCLNKTQLAETEEQCKLYKERCTADCQERFGNKVSEPLQDDDYYAVLRAKSLEKITRVKEEERRLRSEKKRTEFNILKKNMEEAEAHKIEEKKNRLEEDKKLLEEIEKVDQLNDMRREEERRKLMQYYSTISEAVDKRKERAEWKIRRAELHEKRVEFYKNTEHRDALINDEELVETTNDLENCLLKHDSSIKLEEKTEKMCNIIPGSGDHIQLNTEKEKDFPTGSSDVTDRIRSKSLKVACTSVEISTNTNLVAGCVLGSDSHPRNLLHDDKRDWLIALNVADQARQSAVRFKERNMHNDYNILTGEVTNSKDRFAGKPLTENKVSEQNKNVIVDLVNCSVQNNTTDTSVQNYSHEVIQVTSDVIKGMKTEACENVSPILPDHSSCSSIENAFENVNSKSNSVLRNVSERLGTLLSSKSDLNIDEIDMTSVYQNLRMSVMIPLLTQLELANEAVLRLLFDHLSLLKHLECIRRYFFLLDGEFGRNLTRNLFAEMQVVMHPSYLLNVSNLNSLLRSAVGTSGDEEFTERLSFFVKEIPSAFRLTDPYTLDCLSMRYRTHWPLNVIITDDAIVNCDRVFGFLIQLQRTSWALEQDIYLLKDKRLSDSLQHRQVQLYRHIMTHFVTTLKNYVTAVVLEESWFQFKEELKKVTDLNDIYAAHVNYIKMLLFRSLLNKRSKKVNGCLLDLFGIILTFHEMLRGGEWTEDITTGHYQHSLFSRLRHQFFNFLKMSKYLYAYLERLVTVGYQPHLVQLLTLLSANNFYSDQ